MVGRRNRTGGMVMIEELKERIEKLEYQVNLLLEIQSDFYTNKDNMTIQEYYSQPYANRGKEEL